MKFLWLVAFSFMLSGTNAMAECRGRTALSDWSDGFKNQKSAFEWCKQRVIWWELNQSQGWEERYCRSNRYPFGQYGEVRWDAKFWHQHKSYSGRYPSNIFNQFASDYNHRLFKGWRGRIFFDFDERCDYVGPHDEYEVLEMESASPDEVLEEWEYLPEIVD